ncbi:hypothetical protein BX616_002398 [Lobosporangium transversale]|nr:hypothetical protein BX616_002398 [Lobosporangium transversale]
MERAMRGVNGQSGRGRGQGPQGHNTARGGGRGGGSNRGHHDGGRGRDLAMGSSHGGHRGRGRFDDEARAQIVSSRRPTTHQIASEGTDDIIVAAPAAEKAQHIASFILRKQDFKAFHDQRQIRTFVNSCLLNLSNHHSVDTSNILTDLSSRQGLARLKELILMPMHVDAGCEKSVLSFQYVILPLIGVLTRESVCLSTMTSETGVIYSMVYLHHRQFLTEGVLPCMDKLLERRSLRDYSAGGQRLLETDDSICRVASLQCALLAITRLVYQLIKRTKDARVEMAETVKKLKRQQECCVLVTENSSESRFTNEILTREVNRLQEIIIDAQDITIESIDSITNLLEKRANRARGPNMVNLAMAYDPPGHLSKDGPRHDNDKTEISQITLLPTMSEIICYRPPFLPSNDIPDAPHFIPPGWRRQLDIHFRLYREDLMDSLRKGVMGFLSALERIKKGQEGLLLKQKELRKHLDNNVSLNVYGNVQFMGLACTKQLSGSVEVAFAQPPQVVDSPKKRRMEFWERSRRRLMKGALVCIARRIEDRMNDDGLPFQMILGVITRRETDDLAKDEKFAHIHISLADPIQYITIIRSTTTQPSQEQWFLVESMGGFFESYRPILKALQLCMPASLPFGKYIAPSKADETVMQQSGNVLVDPPLYSRAPGFTFDLSVVLNGQQQRLDVSDPNSIMNSKRALQRYSTLDDTQAEALVETLCREVALISGPPGTGKTKIGVDLMEVLLHNKTAMNCGPILCICYTNHALDQFLEHLLDKKITKIVRVGARSKSERLEDYNLESLMKSRDRSFGVRQSLRTAHVAWENACEKVKKLEKALRSEELEWEYVEPYLFVSYPDLFEQFDRQPGYQGDDDELADDGFTVVGGKKVGGVYKRWISGVDIEDKRKANEKLIEDFRSQVQAGSNKFAALDSNFSRLRPRGPILHHIPDTNRPIHLLTGNIWDMSLKERERLQEKWRPEIQEAMVHELSNLLQQIEKADQLKSDAFDDIRRGILKETDVIGMTTNGAAKHQTLISAVAPKIIICEEAGEVLESHILATLSVSTQHLILIGDHLQLRPSIETYNLSTESAIGQNYNLDKSLFERLVTATNPLPMSHLTIQRRMRPEISSLIRNTLYPHLVDGERVFQYPPVNGLGANLFFMDHQHAEDSKDEYGMQSFANSFEVNMIEALAKYLIKNGYDKPGDIAVLTPYLGQLSKLRDKLRQSFMLMIDERDQEQLDMKDEEKGEGNTTSSLGINEHVGIKKIGLQSHLTLRTIDNYQGEEAKIVIISLVRSNVNDNGTLTGSSSIGFLKSPNRTNVLLSRAQHGMYIIGNAGLMENAKKGIWPQIMRELQQYDRIGDGFPLVCKNHPEAQNIVTEPDGFKIVSPNGGCTLSCGSNMPCGHVCPLHCEPTIPEISDVFYY